MAETNEVRWSLYAHFWQAFVEPFERAFQSINDAVEEYVVSGDTAGLIRRFQSVRFDDCGSEALRRVSETTLQKSISDQLSIDLGEVLRDSYQHLRPIVAAQQEFVVAINDVAKLDLPDGTWSDWLQREIGGFFRGYRIGSLVNDITFPGFEAVLAFGNEYRRGKQEAKQIDDRFDRLDGCLARIEHSIGESFKSVWVLLSSLLRRSHGLDLGESSLLDTVADCWNSMLEALPDGNDLCSLRESAGKVARFVETYGPYPNAINGLVYFYLDTELRDLAEAKRWSRIQCKLFACDPDTYHNAANIYLESNEPDRAVRIVNAGVEKFPDSLDLRLERIESLASCGELSEASRFADEELKEKPDCEAFFYHARGLARSGNAPLAAKEISRWMTATGAAASIGLAVRSDPWLKTLVQEGLLKIPEGIEADIRGIVERHLHAYLDEPGHYLGRIDARTKKNAKAGFLRLRSNEEIIFLWDWSFLGDFLGRGKSGLAITNQRVQWKAWLEEPVRVPFNHLKKDDISVSETSIRVRNDEVDLEDEVKAELLAQALQEIVTRCKQSL